MIRNKRWLIVGKLNSVLLSNNIIIIWSADLRSLTCSLVMRGELEGSLKLLDCLKELNGLSTFLGRCFVRGMVKNGSDLQSILNVINEFSEDKHGDSVQVCALTSQLVLYINHVAKPLWVWPRFYKCILFIMHNFSIAFLM